MLGRNAYLEIIVDYKNIHDKIIEMSIKLRGQPNTYYSGRRNTSISEFHLHHIKPKSMGGSNDGFNIAILTPREHFVVHHLLHKIYGGKMTVAFRMMIDGKHTCHGTVSSRAYSKLVSDGIKARSDNPEWVKNRINANKKLTSSKKWLEDNAIRLKLLHADADFKAAHLSSMKRRSENLEWVAFHQQKLREMHESDTYKANHAKAMEKLWSKPEQRISAAKRIKEICATPKWKESTRIAGLSKRKPVIGKSLLDGTEICFVGSVESNSAGFSDTKITRNIKGKSKTHAGYVWRYATRNEVESLRPNHEWLKYN